MTSEVDDIYKAYFAGVSEDNSIRTIKDHVKFIKIACGGNHSIAIDKMGDIYVWGYGKEVSFNFKYRVN